MAVEVATPEELLLMMQEYHAKHAAEMVSTAYEETEAQDVEGRVRTKPKAKQMPRYRLYHLKYGHEGKIIDYHEDYFRIGLDALWKKLQRRYPKEGPGAGLPIWTVKLPEGAQKPPCTIPCNYPGCTLAFSSQEERELHQRGFHQDWANMERDRQGREERLTQTNQLASLIQQNQETQLELRELIGGFQEMVGGFTAVIGKLVEGRDAPTSRKTPKGKKL